jgi:uncharacterized protein (TIGR03437 family)
VGLRPNRLPILLVALSSTPFAFAAPQLRLSQTVVGPVSVAAGANAGSVTVDAVNAGDGNLNLQLASSVPWIVPTVGALRDCPLRTGGCLPIQMELRTASLQRGLHTGIVTVTDPNALDAPQTITVTVAAGGNVPERVDFFLPPNGSSTRFDFQSTSFMQSVPNTQSGGAWLAVGVEGAGSFRFGQTIPYRITATHPPGLPEGSYNGEVVTSGSPIAAENRTIPVTLRVTSQPIAQLSPERLTFRIAQGSARQTQYISIANRGLGTLNLTGATASGGNWLTAQRVEGQNLVAVVADPSGVSPGSYQGTVALASNAVQGELRVPVQLDVIAAGPPLAYYNGLVNNATFEAGDLIGQGAIVAVFGEQFTTGEAQVASSLPLGNELGGVRVFVNNQPAPVYYASYNQINFQIPYNAAPGDAVIRIEREGQRGNQISTRIVRGAPRLLRLGIGDYGIAVHQDQAFPIAPTPGVNSRPARPGDTLVFYAIGLGPTDQNVQSGAASPSSPLARLPGNQRVVFGFAGPFGHDAVETTPLFVGLTPNFVGLYQINVTVPEDAPRGPNVPVALVTDDGVSNRVTIAIQ